MGHRQQKQLGAKSQTSAGAWLRSRTSQTSLRSCALTWGARTTMGSIMQTCPLRSMLKPSKSAKTKTGFSRCSDVCAEGNTLTQKTTPTKVTAATTWAMAHCGSSLSCMQASPHLCLLHSVWLCLCCCTRSQSYTTQPQSTHSLATTPSTSAPQRLPSSHETLWTWLRSHSSAHSTHPQGCSCSGTIKGRSKRNTVRQRSRN